MFLWKRTTIVKNFLKKYYMNTKLIVTILVLGVIFLVYKSLRTNENFDTTMLEGGLNNMATHNQLSDIQDNNADLGHGWNSAMVNIYNGTYVVNIDTSNPEEVTTEKLKINLNRDKNTGTIKILMTGEKQRLDMAKPDLVPSCASLGGNDLVMPKGQSASPPNLTNSVCKTQPKNSPDFLNAKTTCTEKSKEWNIRLKESIQAHNIPGLGQVCGQWCLPDKYDSRVIYSWNSGKQAFDINNMAECGKFKGDVFQHFLKIQKALGVNINKPLSKTKTTVQTFKNVKMISPRILYAKDGDTVLTVKLQSMTTPISIKVESYSSTTGLITFNKQQNNFNRTFYKIAKGQENAIANYQLTTGLQSLKDNEYKQAVDNMMKNNACMSKSGFSGSLPCYQQLFEQIGCKNSSGSDYQNLTQIMNQYNSNKKYKTPDDVYKAFMQNYGTIKNSQDSNDYKTAFNATQRCSGKAMADSLNACSTHYIDNSDKLFACYNKGETKQQEETATNDAIDNVESFTTNPNTSEWPKGSGKFTSNVWTNLGYNESQAYNAQLIPVLEDKIRNGKIINYSQCITNALVGNVNPIEGDDSAKNQTRGGICSQYFTKVHWNPPDLKSTQEMKVENKVINMPNGNNMTIPTPVEVTIPPPDTRKQNYQGPLNMNSAQILNSTTVPTLTSQVFSGKLGNYTQCISSPLMGELKILPYDDPGHNNTRGQICSPYYTSASWSPGDTADTRKPVFQGGMVKNPAQILNSTVIPTLTTQVKSGKLNNYTQCITSPLMGELKILPNDDPGHNITRGQICSPYYTSASWSPGDTADTRNPVFQGKGQFTENNVQLLNKSIIPTLTSMVTSGQLNNYTQCIGSSLVGNALPLPGDDGAKNNTRSLLCSPYYSSASWIPGDKSDTRNMKYNPPTYN
jgi:hypothetical protein